jgi:hypothetical protein
MNASMPEAEVSLRLAFWLARHLTDKTISVAIDGAQIRTGSTVHFDIARFLALAHWTSAESTDSWRGAYRKSGVSSTLEVHSRPGTGDVVTELNSGPTLRAECKKGPLSRSKSSREYPLIREALGQLLTVSEVGPGDILAVAVPHSQKFVELAARWRHAPLVARFGIRILTVDRSGNVHGFEDG